MDPAHGWPAFFAGDDTVAALEAILQSAAEADRPGALVALAWQLRQRDTSRALALVDEAEAGLAGTGPEATNARRIAARVALIRGEAHWLSGELAAGAGLAERALRDFDALDDAVGRADAHWLLAWIATHQGDFPRRDAALAAMREAADGKDPLRVTMAEATQATFAVFRDVGAAKDRWGARFASPDDEPHAAAASVIALFLGLVGQFSGDYVQAIRHSSRSYSLGLASGQFRLAIVAATNTGVSFNSLNDHHAALEWMQRGLDLARPRGWPGSTGTSLMQTAETLRHLHRYDAAHDMLQEALGLMSPITGSMHYAVLLRYLAEVELDRECHASAHGYFQQLEQRARTLGESESLTAALRGQAAALLKMNQPGPALEKAEGALAAARSNTEHQIAALRVMADIHSRYTLPAPDGMSAPSAPLHFLQQALALATTTQDYTVPGEFLEAVAREHARIGDTRRAYEYLLQAIEARQRIHSTEASNRASAMQLSYVTTRTRAEGEHHRQLAEAHAARVEALLEANATLEQLGVIGREITGNLDVNAIFGALDRHVHALLDATTFAIYRLEADGRTLQRTFGVEAGRALPAFQLQIDDPESHNARCARERREIVLDVVPGQGNVIAGTLETLSLMFAPLMVGERLLGVMTIQSMRPHAYGEREVAIFRTLCAYGAIALANGEAQAQLIQSEKMASLGQLVANVAHEINTPIAAIKSSGMSIAEALRRLLETNTAFGALDLPTRQLFGKLVSHVLTRTEVRSSREERALVREVAGQLEEAGIAGARHKADLLVQLNAQSSLADYLELLSHPEANLVLSRAQSNATIISGIANINTAVDQVAKILFALKSFSRMDSRGERVLADLSESLETVLTIYQNQIRRGTELIRHYEPLPPLYCLPDELNQVWTNLIHNALQAMNYQGTLTIGLSRVGNDAVVSVGDTGCGIPAAIRGRIFDPFFTTKPVGEGSGLGLDIVRKIVDKHKGRIEVQSEVGRGTTFVVSLPYESPLA